MKHYVKGLALSALALSGCSLGSGLPPPYPNNPSSASITFTTASGAPAAGLTATLSTNMSGTTPTGVVSTATTDANGNVTFSNLPTIGLVCVSAVSSGSTAWFCKQPFPASKTVSF